jgi:Ser/Thr protein kinase RdoA (MazF antagonist)
VTGGVHAMRGGTAPRDWPALRAAEVGDVLRSCGLESSRAVIRWHSPRPFSAAAIVDLADRPLFIKRHHQRVRTVEQLEEEHGFIMHLHTHGVPVSPVLRFTDGRSALALEPYTYEVHELGAGADLYRDTASWEPFTSRGHAVAAGRALAQLHGAARLYAAPPRAAQVLVSNDAIIRAQDPLGFIRRDLERRPALRDYLSRRDWQADLARAVLPHHRRYHVQGAHIDPLWTHNDWHASNLLWSGDGADATVRTVLDFGLADRTTAIYDLATAIERNTIPWLDIHAGRAGAANLPLADGLLQGYASVAGLAREDLGALAAMLPLVHVGYALAEIDYFHGITRSAGNADLAYHAFLLGHSNWFLGPEGQRLLQHLNDPRRLLGALC